MTQKIDLKAFLDAAFGWIDAESGYGAQYPGSRDMLRFFQGRLGNTVSSAAVIRHDPKAKREIFQSPWDESARLLADDLEALAAQIRDRLPASDAEQ